MNSAAPRILAINGGSSSIKFALFESSSSLARVLDGKVEGVGRSEGVFAISAASEGDDFSRPVKMPDQASAVRLLIDWMESRLQRGGLAAVGHRIVHGGPKYWLPQRITPEMIGDLRQLDSFDPEHMAQEIMLSEAIHRRFPDLPQVACFDTAFHHALPRVARLLAIPRKYEAKGVRRYGFHGLSYEFLMRELERVAGPQAARGLVILAHLGSGASMAAVREGCCVDTSMAFTPAAGLMMGTRSGDMDPGLASYMARSEKMTSSQFDAMANHGSGLLGVSETSSDMRDLLARENEDVRAAEAVALFCYQAKKWTGAYAAALGGLDTLVFAGGIGENAAPVRARICDGLAFLGIELDPARNAVSAAIISTDASRVVVRVIRTNEEMVIANSVSRILNLDGTVQGSQP